MKRVPLCGHGHLDGPVLNSVSNKSWEKMVELHEVNARILEKLHDMGQYIFMKKTFTLGNQCEEVNITEQKL